MELLSLNFLIFTIAGIWRPIEWSSKSAKLLYNAFTIFVIIFVYVLVLTQFLDIVFVVDNMDDFANNSLIFISIISVCCKATVALIRRSAIINLIQILLKDPCKPRNDTEVAIQMKFEKFIRSCSIKYSILATCSCSGFLIRMMLNIIQHKLPLRTWLPYDYSEPLKFYIASVHQLIALTFATIINVGTETLVFGLFLQTCIQFEIFECRLQLAINKTTRSQENFSYLSLNKERIIMSEYIKHHLSIYNYAKMVNSVFNEVLFCQFFGSILVTCFSVFYISTHITSAEGAMFIAYTICMFVQIFLYCWSGNEVILKSQSIGTSIYNMNWFLLSISERKDLMMIMKRVTFPIKFTSSFLITLSLDSYTNILKASYSAFNMLQQS